MLAHTSQQHQVVHSADEDGGLELTGPAAGAGGDYVNSSPRSSGGGKKCWIAIIALIIAIIALIAASVSTMILIPKINDSLAASTGDTDVSTSEAEAIKTCDKQNGKWSKEKKKCIVDTMSPTTYEPTTMLPTTGDPTTAMPTTPAPTTADPSPSPTPDPTTWAPTVVGETRPPTKSPTTAEPTTAMPTTAEPTTGAPTTKAPTKSPSVAPTETNVVIENYYTYENITKQVQCDCPAACPTKTYGVLNAGQLWEVGGYYGWEYSSSYPDLYPLADIHISVGDRILFKARDWTPDDLWLVTEEVYNSCDWSDTSNLRQLANNNQIRGDCENNPHLPCGYEFLAQEWHTENYGNPLYFASAYRWADTSNTPSCVNGVKVKVYIDNRTAIPVVTDGDGFDISATDTVKDLQASIGHLSRMLILAQFSTEQRVRSEGDSGLTNVRGHYDGDAAYDDGTYTNGAVASIHDHSDNIIVVGIGEIQAVLNGVEFRTRHNDYNLNMPHRNSTEYGATEPIPGPEVPPSVSSKTSIPDQVLEMQEYFRAFKTQNISHRDYRDYFKPILCYLEGTWILDEDELDEPFDSDRHQIDAKSWKQLHDKIRWMSNSGRKNSAENLAHLPSCIRNLVNDTYPIVSNWEYRIVCHPLENDVPLSRLRIADDLSVQLMGSPETREELYNSRRARFEINKYIDPDDPDGDHRWSPGRKRWNYLDYLMEQIPGKDNYLADITDELPDGTEQVIHYNTDLPVNSGYYSRYYGLTGADAMGSSKHRRSWSDRYLFAAKTTQSKVSPVEFDFEMEDSNGDTTYHRTISRWSYAIPLEIIYQTPLSNWNPHGIEFIDRSVYDYRSGACDTANAYNGWTTNNAYFTPAGFFDGITESSSADTAKENVCALDSTGAAVPVYSSGHWITFPEIANDVGIVRQRFPIFPIHNGGSAAFKEVKALQAVVLPTDYDDPVANPNGFFGDSRDLVYGFELSLMGGGHQHICYIPGWRVRYYWQLDATAGTWKTDQDSYITADCEERNGHSHEVRIWREYDTDGTTWVYRLRDCRFGTSSDSTTYPTDWGLVGTGIVDPTTGTTVCGDNHSYFYR